MGKYCVFSFSIDTSHVRATVPDALNLLSLILRTILEIGYCHPHFLDEGAKALSITGACLRFWSPALCPILILSALYQKIPTLWVSGKKNSRWTET